MTACLDPSSPLRVMTPASWALAYNGETPFNAARGFRTASLVTPISFAMVLLLAPAA